MAIQAIDSKSRDRSGPQPVVGGCDRLDGGIQHGVAELGIRARADRSADDLAIEAVVHERQMDLARRDLELNDVGEPFLVGLVDDNYLGRSTTTILAGF